MYISGGEHKIMIRPPNRKKFEEEVESISDKIKALEQERSVSFNTFITIPS